MVILSGTLDNGKFFEHFILQEYRAYRHYSVKDFPVSYWRTASESEVDLILVEVELGEVNYQLSVNSLHLKNIFKTYEFDEWTFLNVCGKMELNNCV